MPRKRQNHSAEFKFRMTLEPAKGQRNINEIASEYDVHPNQIREWKQELLR